MPCISINEKNQFVGISMEFEADNDKLMMVLEHTNDLIVNIDSRGKITYASPSLSRLTKMKRKDIIGKDHFSMIHPDEKEKITDAIMSIYKNNGDAHIELRIDTPDGWAWTEWGCRAQFGKDKKIDGVLCIGKNVEHHRNLEDRLNEKDRLLNDFFESIPDAILMFDKDLNLIDNNSTLIRYMPELKEHKQIVGMHMENLIPEYLKPYDISHYKGVLSSRKTFSKQKKIIHPIFGILHVYITAFAMGNNLGIIISDITKRVKIENERKFLLKEIKRKHKELKNFTSALYHDMQTPLTSINAYIDLLEKAIEAGDKEDIRECMDVIKKSSKKISFNSVQLGEKIRLLEM